MDSNPQSKDLTPEERLFKIIQDGEKADEKSDTLSVSGRDADAKEEALLEEGLLSKPSRPLAASPEEKFSEEDLHLKKARRALSSLNAQELFGEKGFRRFLTIKTANRALLLTLVVLLIYFLNVQVITKASPNAEFLKKAGAGGAAPMNIPADLFSARLDSEELAKRNLFQPWRPLPPSEANAPVAEAAAPQTTFSIMSTMKLSGVYLSDVPEALIEATDEKKTYAVKAGSVIKGLTVKAVKAEGVVLTDGKSEATLQ